MEKKEVIKVCKIGFGRIKAFSVGFAKQDNHCKNCKIYNLSDEISVETEELICSSPGRWLLVTLKEGVIVSAKAL